MNTITFVVTQRYSPDGRFPFSILRMTNGRQAVVSYHTTMDEAAQAAHRYASTARFSGLDAQIYQRDWLLNGARPPDR
jgi:hypothetical protein